MTGPADAANPSAAGESAVLVVDDDPYLLALLALALRRAGMSTLEAADGHAALEALASDRVCCVVADLGIPGMNGIDLVEALRRRPGTATLPFVVMTGSADRDSVIAALDAGADDFIAKPVRLEELVARVRAHLSRRYGPGRSRETADPAAAGDL